MTEAQGSSYILPGMRKYSRRPPEPFDERQAKELDSGIEIDVLLLKSGGGHW